MSYFVAFFSLSVLHGAAGVYAGSRGGGPFCFYFCLRFMRLSVMPIVCNTAAVLCTV